jgi:hypothetical protein
MAVAKFYQVAPSGNGSTNTIYADTLAAGADSGVVTTGPDMLIRVIGSLPITIRFGTTANLAGNPATATDIFIPANTPEIFDMGHYNSAISIYTFQNGTVVTVNQVSKN